MSAEEVELVKEWQYLYGEAWNERVRADNRAKAETGKYLEPSPHFYAVEKATAQMAEKGYDISNSYRIIVVNVKADTIIYKTHSDMDQ